MQNQTLYHFTSEHHLWGIGKHGLTVGDVPTDIHRMKGLVGVWLTSSPLPANHGLGGSAVDKSRYRLTVSLALPNLHKWTEWAAKHVAAETISALHATAPDFDTWYIFLGIIRPESILECVDMASGSHVENWREIKTTRSEELEVPAWRRAAWQKRMMKDVIRALRRQAI